MKKWISLIVVVALILSLVLSGCGKASDDRSQTGNKPSETEQAAQEDTKNDSGGSEKNIELRIAWWGSQDRHDRTIKVIEMFEEKYPNVTIQYEFSGWDGYWEKIAAQAAGGNLPDVFQQDYQYLTQYARKGLLLELDPYVEEGVLDLSDVDENSIAGGRVDGKLYGINLGSNAMCVAYDPELFEKAGVPEPSPDWTWEDYMETARKIHEKLGIYGDGNSPFHWFHGFEHYLRQRGLTFYSEDGTKLGYEDDNLFVEFYSMKLELAKEGAVPMPDVRLEVKSVEDELIVTQRAAMATNMWSNQIIAMASAAGRPIKMALLPKDENQVKEGLYIKPSQFFSAAETSENKEMAVKFIDYFTNDIEANKVLMAERGVPISSKVREALMPLLDDIQKQMFEYIDLAAEHSSPIDPPNPPGHPEVDKLLKNLEEQMLYGEISLEDAAVKFREEATKILEKSAQ